jgi:tetratricopeptide (TPR) repeat protein
VTRIDPSMNLIEETFWSYIRGDLDEAAFEAWIYATPDLDSVLGDEDFLAVAGCDYTDKSGNARHVRKETAREIITRHFPLRCACLSTPNIQNLGSEPIPLQAHVEVLAQRSPCVSLARCRECGTHWLIGFDTVDDQIYLHRLSAAAVQDIATHDRWPTVFDDKPNLWPPSRDQIIRNYSEEIRRDPNNANTFFRRGVAHVGKGNLDAAFLDFDQAIRLRQDIAWPFARRGDCYRAKGDIDAALRDYNRAIELDSDHYASRSARYGRGGIYRQRGEFEQAISDYSWLLQFAPRYAGAFKDRGLAYAGLGDFDRAIQDFDRAIDFSRRQRRNNLVVVDAFINRGAAYAARGDDPSAIADFDAALQIDPSHVVALCNRARAKLRAGDEAGGNADLAAARAIDANFVDSLDLTVL